MVDEEEDVFFGLNVVVEGTDGKVGAFRNLADARLMIPLSGEEMKGDIADLLVPSLDESAILDDCFDLPDSGWHGITPMTERSFRIAQSYEKAVILVKRFSLPWGIGGLTITMTYRSGESCAHASCVLPQAKVKGAVRIIIIVGAGLALPTQRPDLKKGAASSAPTTGMAPAVASDGHDRVL
jgi:hypothetical protein